jgi:hypothetical protein
MLEEETGEIQRTVYRWPYRYDPDSGELSDPAHTNGNLGQPAEQCAATDERALEPELQPVAGATEPSARGHTETVWVSSQHAHAQAIRIGG